MLENLHETDDNTNVQHSKSVKNNWALVNLILKPHTEAGQPYTAQNSNSPNTKKRITEELQYSQEIEYWRGLHILSWLSSVNDTTLQNNDPLQDNSIIGDAGKIQLKVTAK